MLGHWEHRTGPHVVACVCHSPGECFCTGSRPRPYECLLENMINNSRFSFFLGTTPSRRLGWHLPRRQRRPRVASLIVVESSEAISRLPLFRFRGSFVFLHDECPPRIFQDGNIWRVNNIPLINSPI